MNSKDEKTDGRRLSRAVFLWNYSEGHCTARRTFQQMAQLMGAYPFLRGLIVPTSQLAEKRMELRKQDSELFMLYQKAEQIKEEKHV